MPPTAFPRIEANESGNTWTCGFNPFNPSVNYLSFGVIYEPLYYIDTLKNAKQTPWLATSYKWSNSNRTLTWDIRKNVNWSDGKPLTAADVVYTFNLLKSHPALDLNAVWSVLSSVSQSGKYTVVMNFKTSAVPYFYYIADQTPIILQHMWKSISNPVNYKDSHPVGTGPFTMQNCTAQNVQYVKNTHYWQPGLPKISKVEYPSFTSNSPANSELATGTAQWGSQFIPNIKAYYLSKSSSNHYWFPPVANVSIFMNETNSLLNNVAVRRAMAYAINRKRISSIGEYGYEPPSNQTAVVLPTFKKWYDRAAASRYKYSYDPAKAISILKAAGFKKGSSGLFSSPAGKPLKFTIINIGGNSDWVASVQVITSELKKVGISLTPDNLSSTVFDSDLYDGKYQLAYNAETGGPSPYYELRQILYSKNSAPIGQPAATNWERYSSPSTDKLITEYGATTSVSVQHHLVDQLEKVMLKEIPVIPVTEAVDWYQYNTAKIGGWVTKSDPYAQPAAYATPDWEVVLLHLYPK